MKVRFDTKKLAGLTISMTMVGVAALGGCDTKTDGPGDPDAAVATDAAPDAGPGVLDPKDVVPESAEASDITLSIYSDGWGTLLAATDIAAEASVVIDVYEETPYTDPAEYYVYAHSAGFYTELYFCTKGQRIDVDLDAVPAQPGSVTGVIFTTQSFFADNYYAGATITVTGPDGQTATITTDAQGRYGLGDVPVGTYRLSFTYQDEDFFFDVVNTAGTDYQDLSFAEPMQAAAPNLYLYPTQATTVTVRLGFPLGGHVTVSEPPYEGGWSVSVDPAGWIDGQYGYLFYEASLPQQADTAAGWLLDGAILEAELRWLLDLQGFVGREIDDFVDFWLPRLSGSPWYAVYPQDAAALVTVDVSPIPLRLRRVLLLIRPLGAPISIPTPPDPPPFPRQGFTAIEWGVLVGI